MSTTPVKIALAAAALLWLAPLSASARSSFLSDVPNGSTNSCSTCHTSAPALNPFGSDVQSSLVSGAPDWSALWDLDSDGDGQTNGEELGDPCGTWSGGTAPRTSDISNPGDSGSTSADPTTPTCGGGDDGGVVDAGVDGGGIQDAMVWPDVRTRDAGTGGGHPTGCTTSGGGAAGLPWLLGLLLIWPLVRRRHRR